MTRREYVWLDDLPIAVVDGVNTASPTVYYVHTDHLGRPARMVAQNWAWVWDVIYSPFGATAAIFDATAKLDMRFPGQWFQMESGLAYNWHRHYDATLGRYVQPDPIGYAGGRSLYGYVGQNPLAYVDPDGRNLLFIIGFCEEFPWACTIIAKETGKWVWDQINKNKPENDNDNCPKTKCTLALSREIYHGGPTKTCVYTQKGSFSMFTFPQWKDKPCYPVNMETCMVDTSSMDPALYSKK